jgi:hypothetical protein
MNRIEPPALPLWMLEHLTPAERDEALAGDLLEGFRGGRSNGWFWRQALGAWLGAWARYLARRRSVLLFALLWSALAPAWTAVIDRVEQEARVIGLRFNAPVSTLPSLMIWLSLQLLFLWAGTVVYFAAFARNRRPPGGILRACGVAAGLFLPTYFATVILMNLFAWPGLEIDRSGMTPLGEIADVGRWAIAIRVPYLVTLLCAMWRAVPRLAAVPRQRAEFGSGAGALERVREITREIDPDTVWRFFAFVVIAGLLNALIAGFLLCRLPESHAPTMASLVVRAAVYVAIGAAAGIMGAWVYWNNPASPFREDPPVPFALFAMVCAAGWLWVPAMVILSEQVSGVTALVAAIGAFLLGAGLRSTTLMVFEQAEPGTPGEAKSELFAESLYEPPGEVHGYFIALCLYAGGWALTGRSNMTAAALLAAGAFLFAWIRAGARGVANENAKEHASGAKAPDHSDPVMPGINPRLTVRMPVGMDPRLTVSARGFEDRMEYRRAVLRLACVVIPAVLVTTWSLIDGVAHRNHVLAMQAALTAKDEGKEANTHKDARGMGGYESVILWPYPEKKQIVAPVPFEDGLLTPGTTRPLVVRFDGPYWYVQPPDERPGPEAHQAVGTPLKVGIESNNALPLIVKAHQSLRAMVRVVRCREIDVDIENRDRRPGAFTMELLLTSTNLGHETRFSLGEQTIDSLEPLAAGAPVAAKAQDGGMERMHSAAFETLRFAVPAHATMRAFNGVTVVLTPDVKHAKVGPRIAIRQFSFVPR